MGDHTDFGCQRLDPLAHVKVGVLRVYLATGRNKSAAADAAHMSRPSFYERLHRIERVLSVDLDSVESCLSLHVALLGLDALRR